jgi:Fanconi-associated nuclease 1
MQGQKIPHPPSTRFNEDVSPPSKRLKRLDSFDADADAYTSRDAFSESETIYTPPKPRRKETQDSEGDLNSEEDGLKTQKYLTELESALPPLKTNKEAIEEYESHRFGVENAPEDLKTRLNSRTWTRGKSSIYVDAFNLALETVLEDEGHLFDEVEMEVFTQWRKLEYEAQYL